MDVGADHIRPKDQEKKSERDSRVDRDHGSDFFYLHVLLRLILYVVKTLLIDRYMLPKYQRLKTKDINYIIKKRLVIFTKNFSFFYVPQYPNKSYNQLSCNITLKIDKRSSQRNILKRAIVQYIQQHNLPNIAINNTYYKIFIHINKQNIPAISALLALDDKKATINAIQKLFADDFTQFCSSI